MGEGQTIAPLLNALSALLSWLKAADVRGMIIGGVAASLLGRPRLTRDIDVLVLLDQSRWQEFLNRAGNFGLVSRLSDALDFARKSNVLLLRHESSAIDVDVVFGSLPFEEEAVGRAIMLKVGGLDLPLPSAEDLLIMKAVAHRTRDLADIEGLLDAHPRLDLERVREWVRQFSSALEAPEILKDLERIISHRK